ncbi:MAG TPA: ATP-binding protein [Candidatus Sulfotelmatobacter sp.]|nr:ATP-binding protein [Candidatus Sulfotelmatobacter sp.]
MTTGATNWPLTAMSIETAADVVGTRQRARRIAELIGFQRQDQTRIATAVSEIARNAFTYAGGGRAEFAIAIADGEQVLQIRISDRGHGIADLPAILDGQYRSSTGMGLGLLGARRLVDRFSIESQPGKGTLVELGQRLRERGGPLTPAKLSEVVSILKREGAIDPLAALHEQNRELLQSLEELRRREAEADQLSAELADTNRGVVALYAELEERAEQLRKVSELKTRFLSNASHEFRTPLNSILALSRLLLERVDGELTAEQEKQVTYIRRTAESLTELVDDLLDLAKVEAGKIGVKIGPISVPNLFSALRGALRPLLAGAAVELIFECADDVPELVTDEAKVAQILRNLVSNALKFTEHGEVRVIARYVEKSKLAIFSVRDTGIGIAPKDQARIFEEFSQLDSQLQKAVKGTGLGLPLSRSLAELLGGTLRVESVVGQGSVFTLTIPSVFGPAARPQPSPPAGGGKKRILLVDDDETFRYIVRQMIDGELNYEVLDAADGRDGLRIARDRLPDVIVLDLQMPEMDGFQVLRELSTDPRVCAIPVIVLTSMSITPELRTELPAGVRLMSKNMVSRDNLSLFLRDAASARDLQ